MKRDLQLLPPETLTGLSTTAPKDRAAGTKAVTVALKHVASELGLGEGLKLLNRMNQEHACCPGRVARSCGPLWTGRILRERRQGPRRGSHQ